MQMERINKVLLCEDYLNITQEIITLEQGRPFCIHTLQHFIDVGRIAWILWLEEVCDAARDFSVSKNGEQINIKECFYAVGLLHDIGRAQQYLTGLKHPLVSAKLAAPLLEKAQFNKLEIEIIISAIKAHNQPNREKAEIGKRPITKKNEFANSRSVTRAWKVKNRKKLWLRSKFINIVQRADILSRPCYNCLKQAECYKLERMLTQKGLVY